MTRKMALSVMVAAGLVLAPISTFAQSHGDKVQAAKGSEGSSGGSSGGSGGSSGGASGGGTPRSGGSSGSGGNAASGGSSGGGTSRSGHAAAVPRSEGSSVQSDRGHERDGRPVTGQAVRQRPGYGGGGGSVIPPGGGYWGGYYPWGWGGLGLGGYYAGFYDPWFDAYPGDYGGYYSQGYEGSLRIKVKPREAEVYVDGYFAGEVDEFDGMFQSLKVETGPHRIELRAEGYEPLFFEVRVQPDRTITYTSEMKKLP